MSENPSTDSRLAKIKRSRILFSPRLNIPYFFTEDYCLDFLAIRLRDIQGIDLCYLDFIKDSYDSTFTNSVNFIFEFLSHFLVGHAPYYALTSTNPIKLLTLDLLFELYQVYLEKVMRSPMSRDRFIKNIYYLNGGKFTSLAQFENIPMTEILHMIEVHNNYQKSLKNDN